MYVGYWFWGNMLAPSFLPSLTGTLLTPIGDYAAYIDLPTFVDYLIINELTFNVDAYTRSAFFHKDRDGRLAIRSSYAMAYDFMAGEYHQINAAAPWSPTPAWSVTSSNLKPPRFRNRRHDSVLLTTKMSGFPSLSKSPIVTPVPMEPPLYWRNSEPVICGSA